MSGGRVNVELKIIRHGQIVSFANIREAHK